MAPVIQFKRGTASRWLEIDPILAVGEPGYETDSGRLKIGDGTTKWSELLYSDEKAVVSRNSRFEFPSFGKLNTIYKDESAGTLYQYIDGQYKILGTEGVLDITFINGGNANGTA